MSGSSTTFSSWDGLAIAFTDWPGSEPAALLQHGFVADTESNWVRTGIVDALRALGRRVIAVDARGHGRSEKPHDGSRYGERSMARDLAALLDLLAVPEVDLVGYSMGAIVALLLASEDIRVRRLVIGGVGSGVVECGGVDRRVIPNEAIIEALETPDAASIVEPGAAAFRALADAVGADRRALLAQAGAIHRDGVELARVTAPTLLLAGSEDPLALRPQVLCDALPEARLQMVPGDHMSAVVDPLFVRALVGFLT